MLRRPAVLVPLALLALVAGVVVYLRPIAPIATGYAARIGCGVHLLQGRDVADTRDDLPPNPLVPFLRVSADGDDGVRATLLGLAGSTARVVPGSGCVLEGGDGEPAPELAAVVADVDDLDVPDDPTAAATDAGIDVDALGAAIAAAFEEDADEGEKGTRAVLVVQGGTVVAEEYAPGFGPDTPLLGWSMTKSVAHALVGRAAAEGLLDPDADDLLPAWDDERTAITFDDLLTMTDGLAFEEVYDPGTDATEMLFTPVDAGAYAADKPLVAAPGTRWSYSSGTSNVVCDAVAEATGAEAGVLLRDLVLAPLSLTSATVGADAGGDPVCSSFMYATARDWARFGLWYLQDGEWGGRQLLPDGWAAAAATPVDVDTVEDGELTPYGRHWWLNADRDGALRFPSVPRDAYWASGNEGQQVVVLPSQDAVVVRLGLSRGLGGSTDWGLERLLAGVVDALP